MPDLNEIPARRRFKISEVCQITDTQPYVLRFWESEFPQLAPRRSGGQVVYRREDIALVLRIKRLLYDEEYTIEGARKRLEQELSEAIDSAEPSPPEPAERDERASGARIELAEGPSSEPHRTSVDEAGVSRERYEDALEEIAHLRLKLREAETTQRRLEARAQKAEQGTARCREVLGRTRGRLEELMTRLD